MNKRAFTLLLIIIGGCLGLLYAQYVDEDKLLLQQYKLPVNAVSDTLLTEIDSVMYINGKPFTGTEYSLYSNQKLQHTAQYINGRKHGTMYVWYPDGKPQLLSNYRNGYLSGKFKGWYQFGAVIYDLVMNEGRYSGDQLHDTDATRTDSATDDSEKTGDVIESGND